MTNCLTLGAVEKIQNQSDRSIQIKSENSVTAISILAANLIRVKHSFTEDFKTSRSWAITRDDNEWFYTPFKLEKTAEKIKIFTEKIQIEILQKNSNIRFFDNNNNPIAHDTLPRKTQSSYNATVCWKRILPGEHFYGFGERTGLLEQRGKRRKNWTVPAFQYQTLTDNLYQAIPFFISLRPNVGYGIFLNTTFESQFDVGVDETDILRIESKDTELDYYLIYGPQPDGILQTYTQLTGRMPLPPLWALGYHQSRWGYETEEAVRQIAEEFRDRQIPCDAIHLDIDYMRGYRVFTWSPEKFPHPQQLINDLLQEGFKTVAIIDPGVKYEPNLLETSSNSTDEQLDYPVFTEGFENNYFVRDTNGKIFTGYVWPGKAVFPDFLCPEVRDWWGNLHKDLIDIGIKGIWNDMNEPSIDDRPMGTQGRKIPLPLNTVEGPVEEKTTHAEVHNLYGMMMVKACCQALSKFQPNQRFFVLTRSGYAGIQKLASVWTGDNQSCWEHLEMSMPMLCNLGLSGVAFVGCDIGGFFGDATGELVARWTQIGVFNPLMRNHSKQETANQEPWQFGNGIEAICREYIELRYQLLPYLYSLFWEAATTGAPILRPLLYHYPNDVKTYQLHSQVLLGNSLMAAPIYRPGVEYRVVYLPEGVWYDWWSGDRYVGPVHIMAYAPLEKMPIYAKAGAIIPMTQVRQYIEQQPYDELRLKVYPGNGEFTLYEDDGETLEYQNSGVWATTKYQVQQQGEQIIVDIEARQGSWALPTREIIVEVVGVGEKRFSDDGSANTLTLERG